MKLFYYQSKKGLRNFGDDLNPWLWKRIFPNVFNGNSQSLFLGIGTILNSNIPEAKNIAVLGAGAGYGELPKIDARWKIYSVRGPLTAEALHLPPELGIIDPAILGSDFFKPQRKRQKKFAYMPHYQHAVASDASLKRICDDLAIDYIDPRLPVDTVLEKIGSTDCMLAEAMHAAVAAEAFRIPWIPVVSTDLIYTFKWEDWCRSIDLEYHPQQIIPLWNLKTNASLFTKLRHSVKSKIMKYQLKKIMRHAPRYLTENHLFETKKRALWQKCQEFSRDFAQGHFN